MDLRNGDFEKNFDKNGLTRLGASKIQLLLERNPRLSMNIGITTETKNMGHSWQRTELRIDDLRPILGLPDNIDSGEKLYNIMPHVSTGFNDYGKNVIGIDKKRLKLLALGVNIEGVIANER